MIRLPILICLLAASAFGQCTQWVFNPFTQKMDCAKWGSAEAGSVNAVTTFTAETTVVFAHNLGTNNVVVQCYDGSGVGIDWATITRNSVNQHTITFSPAATGSCVANGYSGASAYVYVAYASDDAGTGFTTTFDADLDYLAVLATDTAIPTPEAADFAGLWKHYGVDELAVRYSSGAGAPAAACTAGGAVYLNTSDGTLYDCTATDTWRKRVNTDAAGSVTVGTTVLHVTSGIIVPLTVAASSPASPVTTGFYLNDTAGAITYNIPAITSGNIGMQMCFRNAVTRTGAITLQLPASTSLDIEGVNGTAAGTFVSSGAAGDSACVVAQAVGQYIGFVGVGIWTNN